MNTASPPSRAKAFFDQIEAAENGAEYLKSLLNPDARTGEDEFVDFKGGRMAEKSESEKLRGEWAKCLSCFANSDGGVVVFGIHAPDNKPTSLQLVEDVEGLKARLDNWLPKLTEPPVVRVETKTYADPKGAKTGFVVCFIPPSPWRPHQSKNGGEPGQYFIRARDNCVPCSHSTLRALFAPQKSAWLHIFYRFQRRELVSRGRFELLLVCWLHNAGPSTASEAFVLCECSGHAPIEFKRILWENSASGMPGHAVVATRSIHPEEMVSLFTAVVGSISTRPQGAEELSSLGCTFKFSISARDQLPTRCMIQFDGKQVVENTILEAEPIQQPEA